MNVVDYQLNASDFGVLWTKTAALGFFKCPVVGPPCDLKPIWEMYWFTLSGVYFGKYVVLRLRATYSSGSNANFKFMTK